MASHVQVILREDIETLGTSGELVRVRPGYARNYLIPRGVAVMATRGNVERIEHEKKLAVALTQKKREAAVGEANKLAGVVVQISKQAGEEGRLFGSVTAQDIAAALAGQGIDVDKKKIQMPTEPIKQVGRYEIKAKLVRDVFGTFVLDVVGQA